MIITKKYNGFKVNIGESVEYEYIISDAPYTPDNSDADDTVIMDFALSNIPSIAHSIKLTSVRISEQLNNTTWLAVAEYKNEKKSFPNQKSLTFDTSGNTVHKTFSIQRVYARSTLYNAIPEEGNSAAIGFNGEDIEGVDIETGGFNFSETHPIPDSAMTQAFRKNLSMLSKTINNAPFRGYEAGEVMFKGVRGSKNGDEKWSIVFEFEVIHNQTNFPVGDIEVPFKKGWDYIHARYSKKLADGNAAIVPKLLAVYIDQVYEYTDFSLLGIDTGTWEEVIDEPEDIEPIYPTGV